jgi:BlaI family transcriptional regulator, penicillinase repressor
VPPKNVRPPLSEAQVEIMNVVWDRGECTVGEVWSELSKRRSIARNTVQTMIVRLEEKGWLKHRVDGNTFHYRATQAASTARRRIIRRLVETVFRGSTEGLLLAVLEEQPLTEDAADRIRAMLDIAKRREP